MKKIITGPPFNAKCLNNFPFFLPPLLSVAVRDMEKGYGYILSVLLTKYTQTSKYTTPQSFMQGWQTLGLQTIIPFSYFSLVNM